LSLPAPDATSVDLLGDCQSDLTGMCQSVDAFLTSTIRLAAIIGDPYNTVKYALKQFLDLLLAMIWPAALGQSS